MVAEGEESEKTSDSDEDEESDDFGPGVVVPRAVTPASGFFGTDDFVSDGAPESVINDFLI